MRADRLRLQPYRSRPLSGGVYHYTLEDLDNKLRHAIDVPVKNLTEWHIDHMQMGVGGDNSWGYHTHEIYKLIHNEYCYSFNIFPVYNSGDAEGLENFLLEKKTRYAERSKDW